jgi:hypothetical protein
MKRVSLLLFVFLPSYLGVTFAEDFICPPLPPLSEGADELRMPESDFTPEQLRIHQGLKGLSGCLPHFL